MSKEKTEPDELIVRVQLYISEVASPDLYADLISTKVRSRRYRLAHLAALGLLVERSILQGGAHVASLAHNTASAQVSAPAQGQRKPSKKEGAIPVKEPGATLEVPSNFGDLLMDELSI